MDTESDFLQTSRRRSCRPGTGLGAHFILSLPICPISPSPQALPSPSQRAPSGSPARGLGWAAVPQPS